MGKIASEEMQRREGSLRECMACDTRIIFNVLAVTICVTKRHCLRDEFSYGIGVYFHRWTCMCRHDRMAHVEDTIMR